MSVTKEAKTVDEQISILKSRNLIIEDEEFAKHILSSVNYYNFTGYLYPYRDNENMYNGITFNNAYRIYLCDKKIKNIILYSIELVECNLKTHMAYIMAHSIGPLGYMDANNFTNEEEHNQLMTNFKTMVRRNKKLPFVKHHITKYDGNFPVWVAIELFTLGMIRNCYTYLKNPIRKEIAAEFKTGAKYLESWIECVSYLRNLSAHYMQLYRVNIQKTPKRSKTHNTYPATHRIFDILCVIRFLLPDTKEWKNYILPRFKDIFDEYKDIVFPNDYGFPDEWEHILTM